MDPLDNLGEIDHESWPRRFRGMASHACPCGGQGESHILKQTPQMPQ